MNSSDIKKQNMIRALNNSLGIVTSACKAAGIHRSTHYAWMRSDPEYQQEVEDIEGTVIDFAEGHLHELIKGARAQSPKGFYYQLPPNLNAIIFLLKTKGRKRGYGEHTEKVQKKEKVLYNYTEPDNPTEVFQNLDDDPGLKRLVNECLGIDDDNSDDNLPSEQQPNEPMIEQPIIEDLTINNNTMTNRSNETEGTPSNNSSADKQEIERLKNENQQLKELQNSNNNANRPESYAVDGLPPDGIPRKTPPPPALVKSIRIDCSPDNPDYKPKPDNTGNGYPTPPPPSRTRIRFGGDPRQNNGY